MSINDISLTSGMRTNLLSLQSTTNLLNRTQGRLATGKKVNTAIDNPVSFFASQALNSRASKIDSLKDAMGQAVQTITAADKGISAITAMIEQAKGIAQSAMSADHSGASKVTVTAATVVADNTVTIGGVTLTAKASASSDTEFTLGTGGTADADTAANLAAAINNNSTLTDAGYSASVNGAVVTISNSGKNLVSGTDVTSSGATLARADVAATADELSNLHDQYDALRTQITELAEDSGYKGKNLLSSDTLDVVFEGTTLSVTGFSASAAGLGITAADWKDDMANISGDITLLDTALDDLRTQSSTMSSNLSIISVRQDFSTNMINTLTEGADKLTLADTNEEGANMLMLQTRQSLATTALSLSSQAAQAVLRLFG